MWTYNEQTRQWQQDGATLTGHTGAPCIRSLIRGLPAPAAALCAGSPHAAPLCRGAAHGASPLPSPPPPLADWVRDVAWAPNFGLPMSTLASAGQDGKAIIWTERQEGACAAAS